MQSYKCAGNYSAIKICNNQLCEELSPFLCDNNISDCHCSQKHCHNDQMSSIKYSGLFDKINKIINLFQLGFIKEIDQIIDKIILKLTNQLNQKRQELKNESKSYLSKYLNIPIDLVNNYLEINQEYITKIKGKIIYNLNKQIKEENKIKEAQQIIKKIMHQTRNIFKIIHQKFHLQVQKIKFISKANQEKVETIILKRVRNELIISDKQMTDIINFIQNTPRLNLNSFKNLTSKRCDQHFKYFLFTFQLTNLKMLNLNQNNLKDTKFLLNLKMPNLEQLKLMSNQIDDNGFYYLAKCKWEKIFYFNLSANYISYYYLKDFLSQYSKKLKRLDLDNNLLDSKAFLIIKNAKWPLLTEFHIYDNKFNEGEQKQLNQMFTEQIKQAEKRNSQIKSSKQFNKLQ